MTIAELAKVVGEMRDEVMTFMTAQVEYNKLVCKNDSQINGNNGNEGMKTTLVKLDGRLVSMEDINKRRQKLVDGLVAAFALMAIIEIVRLIAPALP
jgi:hypothetical protein